MNILSSPTNRLLFIYPLLMDSIVQARNLGIPPLISSPFQNPVSPYCIAFTSVFLLVSKATHLVQGFFSFLWITAFLSLSLSLSFLITSLTDLFIPLLPK